MWEREYFIKQREKDRVDMEHNFITKNLSGKTTKLFPKPVAMKTKFFILGNKHKF